MLSLKSVHFNDIQHWFVDYQKKSKNYEMPSEHAECLGIYKDQELIGYFIVVCYEEGTVEINQGYLKPAVRHKQYSPIAMKLLEQLAKEKGFKRILLGTNRAANSYIKFMSGMGYTLSRAEFSKEI